VLQIRKHDSSQGSLSTTMTIFFITSRHDDYEVHLIQSAIKFGIQKNIRLNSLIAKTASAPIVFQSVLVIQS